MQIRLMRGHRAEVFMENAEVFMENMENNVGKNIAALRRARGLTQAELAGQLHFTYQAVSNWERGVSVPDADTLLPVRAVATEPDKAARVAAGMGADVIITDISLPLLHSLSISMPANVNTLYSSHQNIVTEIKDADIVIGAVLVPGDKAPKLITRDMLGLMEKGTVLVDVAIDQGGCFETSRPTTHSEPTYEVDGIVHYAVANIPGAVPNTSTIALTNATLKYAVALADKGWQQACCDDEALYKGLNVVEGKVTYKAVAEVFDLPYEECVL